MVWFCKRCVEPPSNKTAAVAVARWGMALAGVACASVAAAAWWNSGCCVYPASETAETETVQIQQAIEMYMARKPGACPKALEDLVTGGIKSTVSTDPWGNDYTFECPGERTSVDVYSNGPDGELGTDDDVANFQKEQADGGAAAQD